MFPLPFGIPGLILRWSRSVAGHFLFCFSHLPTFTNELLTLNTIKWHLIVLSVLFMLMLLLFVLFLLILMKCKMRIALLLEMFSVHSFQEYTLELLQCGCARVPLQQSWMNWICQVFSQFSLISLEPKPTPTHILCHCCEQVHDNQCACVCVCCVAFFIQRHIKRFASNTLSNVLCES